MIMKKTILFLLFMAAQTVLFAQEFYPEGTKWTEIRLDTLMHDSWYSKVGDEWVPNFETIEYYVQGEYTVRDWTYKRVYTNGPEWTDSLTLLIREGDEYGYNCVMATVLIPNYEGDGKPYVPVPGEAYQFDWSVGKGLYFQDIMHANMTSILRSYFYYGVIDEIKEGFFGGVRSLKYVDLDGKAPESDDEARINLDTNGGRIIQGIGITEWNDGECLFGPVRLRDWDYEERHYRSMLVHFERNGEVLYDVWPEKSITDGVYSTCKETTPIDNTLFDLQGRRPSSGQALPSRHGVFIRDGKKILR